MKFQKLLAAGFAVTVLFGCSSTSDKPSADTGTETNEEVENLEPAKEEPVKKDVFSVGETAEVDGVKITVNSAETTDNADDLFNTAAQLKEGKKYEVIDITIENTSNEEINVSSMISFEVKDSEGRKGDYQMPTGDGQLDGTVDPGDKLSGQQIYQVPAEGELTMSYQAKLGGDKVKFTIR